MSTTAYMSLILPDVSSTSGPTWASELNAAISTIDAHDHSSGKGTKVTPSGITINADLTMGINNLTNARSLRLYDNGTAITGASDLNILHCAGGNLYYRDGSGNQIQLTVGGALNASSVGGIGGDYATSTASAFYTTASTKFTFWSNTNVPAILDCGNIVIRKNSASSNGITLAPASGIASDYQITLPSALPGATRLLQIDASGNMAFGLSGISSTDANTVAAARTRSTGTSVSAGGVAISNSSSTFTSASSSYVDVTNLSVTITTSGRPVRMFLMPDGSGSTSTIGVNSTTTTSSCDCTFKFMRDAVTLGEMSMSVSGASAGTANIYTFPSAMDYVDAVAAGTYTYKVQGKVGISGTNIVATRCKLVVYEL